MGDSKLLRAALVAVMLAVAPPALADTPDPGPGTLERLNRQIFQFNQWVTTAFGSVSEISSGGLMPAPVTAMASRVFSNYINEPVTVIAGITAGDAQTVAHAVKRFALNTTLGIGGLFDAAATHGLPARHLDWGLGACARGLGDGPYLVIPLIGPRTSREAVFDVVPAQLIVFYGTYLVLGPFIGFSGVAALQIPELVIEALAFRQMDVEAAELEAEDYDSARDRYLEYRARRCEEYKTELASRRVSAPRLTAATD